MQPQPLLHPERPGGSHVVVEEGGRQAAPLVPLQRRGRRGRRRRLQRHPIDVGAGADVAEPAGRQPGSHQLLRDHLDSDLRAGVRSGRGVHRVQRVLHGGEDGEGGRLFT